MNEQLIKFIELCLVDGVISDKEKEVILRKSKELGVPKDECEIILEGMIIQHKEKFSEKKAEKSKKNVDLKESYVNLKMPEEWLSNLNKLNAKIKEEAQKESIINFIKSGNFKNTLKKSPFVHGREILDIMISQPGNGVKLTWFKGEVEDPDSGTFTLEREVKNKINSILEKEEFWGYSAKDDTDLMDKQEIKAEIKHLINVKEVTRARYVTGAGYLRDSYWNNHAFAIFTNLGIHAFHRNIHDGKYLFKSYDDLLLLEEWDWSMHTNCKKYLFAFETNFDLKSLLLNLKLSYDDQLFVEIVKSFKFKDKDLANLMRVNHYITKSINNYNNELDQLNISKIYESEKIINNEVSDLSEDWDNLKAIEEISSYHQKFILYITNVLMMRDSMLNFLISSDPVCAEKIILELEDLGVLDTSFQRNLLGSLNDITSQLSYLNETILSISNDLVYHLRSIDNKIGQQNDNLSEISRKLTYNNLISTISAYQLWKVNKNTKGLN
jgi:hypothetical protein